MTSANELRTAARDKALDIGRAWALLELAADQIEKLEADTERLRVALGHLLSLGVLNPTGSSAIDNAVADAKALLNTK